VRWGAQVRQAGGLVAALRRGEEMGAEVLQLFAQSSRQWRMPERTDGAYETYRGAARDSVVVAATVCHAPYLVNLASPDPLVAERSRRCFEANLRAATLLGALGLVLHPGSHRGLDPDRALVRLADGLRDGLDKVEAELGEVCDVLLENTAGSGYTLGRSFAELTRILQAAGGDERLGVCVDTQHLWASGIRFDSRQRADQVVGELLTTVGRRRLRCLHVNDSKVPLGTGRDRHENLGAGTVGPGGLRALLGHPDLQGLPAVLEVPGTAGEGPGPAELAVARRLHAEGLAARRRRRRPPAPGSGPGNRPGGPATLGRVPEAAPSAGADDPCAPSSSG
jgi:deoxyribonuclease-4